MTFCLFKHEFLPRGPGFRRPRFPRMSRSLWNGPEWSRARGFRDGVNPLPRGSFCKIRIEETGPELALGISKRPPHRDEWPLYDRERLVAANFDYARSPIRVGEPQIIRRHMKSKIRFIGLGFPVARGILNDLAQGLVLAF